MAENISKYIKEQLAAIPKDSALLQAALVQDLLRKFPSVKDRTKASARINLVMKQKGIQGKYEKITGKDKKVYIRNTQPVESPPVEEETQDYGGNTPIVPEETMEKLKQGSSEEDLQSLINSLPKPKEY